MKEKSAGKCGPTPLAVQRGVSIRDKNGKYKIKNRTCKNFYQIKRLHGGQKLEMTCLCLPGWRMRPLELQLARRASQAGWRQRQ